MFTPASDMMALVSEYVAPQLRIPRKDTSKSVLSIAIPSTYRPEASVTSKPRTPVATNSVSYPEPWSSQTKSVSNMSPLAKGGVVQNEVQLASNTERSVPETTPSQFKSALASDPLAPH